MCNSQPSSPTKVILRARTSWLATLMILCVEKGNASLLRSAEVRHCSSSRLKIKSTASKMSYELVMWAVINFFCQEPLKKWKKAECPDSIPIIA